MKVDFKKLEKCSDRYQEIITKTESAITELEIQIVKLADNSETETIISGLKKDKDKLENVLLVTKKMKAALLKTIEIYLKSEDDLEQIIEGESYKKNDSIRELFELDDRFYVLLK